MPSAIEKPEFHPFADILPPLAESEFDDLREDIRRRGLLHPIVLFEDKILDGRQRLRACIEVGIQPAFTIYDGDDPVGYVIAANIHRRHLTKAQRALFAARLAKLRPGRPRKSALVPILPQPTVARLFGVSTRAVRYARIVKDSGRRDLIEKFEQGRIPMAFAARMVKMRAGKPTMVASARRNIGSGQEPVAFVTYNDPQRVVAALRTLAEAPDPEKFVEWLGRRRMHRSSTRQSSPHLSGWHRLLRDGGNSAKRRPGCRAPWKQIAHGSPPEHGGRDTR